MGAEGLAGGLRRCSNLVELYANNNPNLGDTGVVALCRGIESQALASVGFASTGLGDTGAAAVATELGRWPQLECLQTSNNRIGAVCMSVESFEYQTRI